MVNQYETVFIATPVLSEPQMKEAVAKYAGFLTQNGAEIVAQEEWGLKKLAYNINHKSTGFYCLIEFKGQPDLVDKLETQYRRDERIMRFLTVSLDKDAVAYAERRRAKLAQKASAPEAVQAEETSDASSQAEPIADSAE